MRVVKQLKMERRFRGLYLPRMIIQEIPGPIASMKPFVLGRRNIGEVVH